jgi:hypothetical protein
VAINWALNVNKDVMHPYSYNEASTIITEENDVGTPKTRQRSTGVPKFHTFDMAFTRNEFDTLSQWVRFNLRGGAETFMFLRPYYSPEVYVEMRLIITEGGWFQNYRVIDDEIRITLKLEEQP